MIASTVESISRSRNSFVDRSSCSRARSAVTSRNARITAPVPASTVDVEALTHTGEPLVAKPDDEDLNWATEVVLDKGSPQYGRPQFVKAKSTFLNGADYPPPRQRDYAEETAAVIDEEVRAMLDRIFLRATDILRERRDALERTARRLLEKLAQGAPSLLTEDAKAAVARCQR